MALASVVGGERAWWAAELDVEVDAEGEGEQALNDSLGESGGGFGEVVFEAHLAFEVGEQRLDHEPDAGFGDLGWWTVTELVLSGVISVMSISCIVWSYSAPQKPPSANSRLPRCA